MSWISVPAAIMSFIFTVTTQLLSYLLSPLLFLLSPVIYLGRLALYLTLLPLRILIRLEVCRGIETSFLSILSCSAMWSSRH
jgi:hypothetical protein